MKGLCRVGGIRYSAGSLWESQILQVHRTLVLGGFKLSACVFLDAWRQTWRPTGYVVTS